jgi:chromosomal replication initiation ATPase DnaA
MHHKREEPVTKGELVKSKRGTFDEPRGVAFYLTRRMTRSERLMDICGDYNLKNYSCASSVVENVKNKLLKDGTLRRSVNELSQPLIKIQPESCSLYVLGG